MLYTQVNVAITDATATTYMYIASCTVGHVAMLTMSTTSVSKTRRASSIGAPFKFSVTLP